MNLKVIGAIALLLVWAVAALVLQGPGWVHLLLTIGVSLLIYGVVVGSGKVDEAPPSGPPSGGTRR